MLSNNPDDLVITVDMYGGGFRDLLSSGISMSDDVGIFLSTINPDAIGKPFNVDNYIEWESTYSSFRKTFGNKFYADEVVVFSPNPMLGTDNQYAYAINPAIDILRPGGRITAFISEGTDSNISRLMNQSLSESSVKSAYIEQIAAGQNPLGYTSFALGEALSGGRVGIYDGRK